MRRLLDWCGRMLVGSATLGLVVALFAGPAVNVVLGAVVALLDGQRWTAYVMNGTATAFDPLV